MFKKIALATGLILISASAMAAPQHSSYTPATTYTPHQDVESALPYCGPCEEEDLGGGMIFSRGGVSGFAVYQQKEEEDVGSPASGLTRPHVRDILTRSN